MFVAKRGEAFAHGRLADEVRCEQPHKSFVLQTREMDGRSGPVAQRAETFVGERVHRPLPGLAGLPCLPG